MGTKIFGVIVVWREPVRWAILRLQRVLATKKPYFKQKSGLIRDSSGTRTRFISFWISATYRPLKKRVQKTQIQPDPHN